MAKKKIQLIEGINIEKILENFKESYKDEKVNETDGIKIDFENSWVHLRRSNTEPIVRVYTEAKS